MLIDGAVQAHTLSLVVLSSFPQAVPLEHPSDAHTDTPKLTRPPQPYCQIEQLSQHHPNNPVPTTSLTWAIYVVPTSAYFIRALHFYHGLHKVPTQHLNLSKAPSNTDILRNFLASKGFMCGVGRPNVSRFGACNPFFLH